MRVNLARLTHCLLSVGLFCLPIACGDQLPGLETSTNLDTSGAGTESDVETGADTNAWPDTDQDADSDTGELDTYALDFAALLEEYTFEAIDPNWLPDGSWEEEWPHPRNLPIQPGLCRPNYTPDFWSHLNCFVTQDSNPPCYADKRAAPPMGTPFTCDFWVCEFFQHMLYPQSAYHFPGICKKGEWTCSRCYYELYHCMLEQAATCPAIQDGPAMYEFQAGFRGCYTEVTGYDRCRWIMPDVCDGVVGGCSGAEWPPL